MNPSIIRQRGVWHDPLMILREAARADFSGDMENDHKLKPTERTAAAPAGALQTYA
jgi:hypothetical protein